MDYRAYARVNHLGQRITALTAQKKNPNRINVFLDGDFAFGINRLSAAWLRVGDEITLEHIAELQSSDGFEIAHQYALSLLSRRARTEQEIRDKLVAKEHPPAVIEKVLERMRESKLVADAEFASAWASNRAELHPRSRRLVALELRRKGVSNEQINSALESLPPDEELALQFARAQAGKLTSLERDAFMRRLSGMLARKGFPFSIITGVIHQVWQETRLEQPGE